MNKVFASVVAAFMLLGSSAPAGAEGFYISDWSARGAALAGGLVGRADDASAVMYNPAGITQLPGTRLMMGTALLAPVSQIAFTDASGNVTSVTKPARDVWPVPHTFITHQLNDDFWIGAGLVSRLGLGTDYGDNWPGSAAIVSSMMQSVTFNPVLAWKISEKFSVAVGLEVTGAMMNNEQNIQGLNTAKMDASGVGFSASVAARYQFNDAWAVGLTYRAPLSLPLSGCIRWDRQIQVPGVADMRNSDVHTTMNLPDTAALGLMWKPTPRLSLEADVTYAHWSTYQNLNIYMEGPVNSVMYMPKHWQDNWGFNISAEYQVLDWMTARLGYQYETGPGNPKYADYLIAANGRHMIGTGLGFAWDKWTLDLSMNLVLPNTLSLDEAAAQPGSHTHAGSFESQRVYMAMISVGYRF